MSVKQTPESFWARVKKTDSCWEWQGSCNNTGYGSVAWHGKVYTAHRIAAWLSNMVGTPSAPKSPTTPTHVLHKCDNRRCCNPKHFFLGTFSDNQCDAYKKKRKVQPKGSAHSNSKLTDKQVNEIRKRYAKGEFQVPLAKEYGVSQRVISLIVRGESYKCHL
jgi:hypothetical protein